MHIRTEQARDMLRRIDLARVRHGRPLGQRDSALLALVAAGFSGAEIAALRGSAVLVITGRVMITLPRHNRTLLAPVPGDLGVRLVAWLNSRKLWNTDLHVFTAFANKPFTGRGIAAVLHRHLSRRRSRR
jgi:hypothetical protein